MLLRLNVVVDRHAHSLELRQNRTDTIWLTLAPFLIDT